MWLFTQGMFKWILSWKGSSWIEGFDRLSKFTTSQNSTKEVGLGSFVYNPIVKITGKLIENNI